MTTRTSTTISLRSRILLIFALSLLLRLGLIAAWYTPDLRRFESGDYILYYIGAQHFQTAHDFTNSLFLVRPPLLSIAIVALSFNNLAVLIFNAVVGAMLAPLTYVLARQFDLSLGFATFAGLVAALDPAGVVYSSFLGAEALANSFLLICVIALIAAMRSPDKKSGLIWAIAAALGLIVSSYARPSTHALWIPLSLWLLFVFRKHWRVILTFGLISLFGVGIWIVHNAQVFGNATFSTVGPYTMLYYRAASVERFATGDDMDTIYTRINQRVEDYLPDEPDYPIDPNTRQRYLAATPEVQNALQTVSVEIFLEHPLIYLLTFFIGFGRLYGLLPDALNLLPLTQGVPSIVLQVVSNWLLFLGTLAGLILACRRRKWFMVGSLLIVGAYYTVGTLLVKSAGLNVRERSMLTPFMALLIAYAVSALVERWRSKWSGTV